MFRTANFYKEFNKKVIYLPELKNRIISLCEGKLNTMSLIPSSLAYLYLNKK